MRIPTICLGILSLLPYMGAAQSLWTAGNESLSIGVDKTTGRIERLVDKISGDDYCNQSLKSATHDTDGNTGIQFDVGHRIGGLILFDELRNREFSDFDGAATIANVKATPDTLTFDKRYPGAEFVVTESFRVLPDHVRWDVRVHKTSGPDRTIRVIQFAPLPVGTYQAWAPISDAPFAIKPWLPFSIDYGQSTSGAVGEGRWRTTIPMMAFYSIPKKRAIAFTSPFEIPAVRIRFLSNTSATADFHWNSRQYPLRERPYFQVSNEYLGARDKKDVETGLLISVHPADWRPALGFVYSKYREYFDGDPSFDKWEGSFVSGYEMMKDSLTRADLDKEYAARYARGARWEELHGHFPWYGLMIPDASVKSWINESHPAPGTHSTREKIAEHCKITKEHGIGTFLYYNVTESEYWYAKEKFADSIAKNELGNPIGAWRIQVYPDKRACWLMNADPSTGFGKHMIQQANEMVNAYPEAAGFFWDVYGRSYMFDFAHDDGITMINNKPAYYPEFMYQRLMRDYVRPLLRSKGMLITANKPVTVVSCKGLDGIMAMEDAPLEDSPAWITAQSYLGLNRHVMILEGNGANAEMMYLHCLRYGMFDTDLHQTDRKGNRLSDEQIARNQDMAKKYRPVIDKFRGKQWIFYPQALELPKNTEGNIFRLKDGSVMITMISAWKHLRNANVTDQGLEITCRLPDAAQIKTAQINSVDLGETSLATVQANGDTIKITVPKHGKATAILLSR